MKITEYVEKATAKGYMPAGVNQQDDKIKKDLEVKSYLGIKAKRKLIEDIVDETVIYENGLLKFNGVEQYIVYTMRCIEAYTNLELSDDLEEDYDALCSCGLLAKILRTFDDEYQSVLSLLQMQCDYVLMDNSVTSKINVVLNSMTDTLNKIADGVEKKMNEINPEDLQKVTELLSTLK